MTSTYSSRINALKLVAEHLECLDALQELTSLRKQSDIMEIIGHPKNPANALVNDAASTKFALFRKRFLQVQLDVLDLVEQHSDRDIATQVGQVCFGDQTDLEKRNILVDYLKSNVPKTTASSGMHF